MSKFVQEPTSNAEWNTLLTYGTEWRFQVFDIQYNQMLCVGELSRCIMYAGGAQNNSGDVDCTLQPMTFAATVFSNDRTGEMELTAEPAECSMIGTVVRNDIAASLQPFECVAHAGASMECTFQTPQLNILSTGYLIKCELKRTDPYTRWGSRPVRGINI